MKLDWSRRALADLDRLHGFLAPVNPRAAAELVQALTRAPERLLGQPRMGTRLDRYGPREVRRIFVGDYEMRYEIIGDVMSIAQIWHGREDRYSELRGSMAADAQSGRRRVEMSYIGG